MDIYPNSTIFIQFLQFFVLLIILNFLLFKPVMNALKKRQETLKAMAAKAEDNQHEAEGLGKTYEERLKEQKLPIVEERDGLMREAHSSSMKLIEEARQELAEELNKVKETVRTEAEKALEALKADSGRLASVVAEKIMRRST